jgi:hypothetical protein
MATEHLNQDDHRQAFIKALAEAAAGDAPRRTALYVTFDTEAIGVRLSLWLREQYPRHLTIVLQHQFWDLDVSESGFEVQVAFSGRIERLRIPFASIVRFSQREDDARDDSEPAASAPRPPASSATIIVLDERRKRNKDDSS